MSEMGFYIKIDYIKINKEKKTFTYTLVLKNCISSMHSTNCFCSMILNRFIFEILYRDFYNGSNEKIFIYKLYLNKSLSSIFYVIVKTKNISFCNIKYIKNTFSPFITFHQSVRRIRFFF